MSQFSCISSNTKKNTKEKLYKIPSQTIKIKTQLIKTKNDPLINANFSTHKNCRFFAFSNEWKNCHFLANRMEKIDH